MGLSFPVRPQYGFRFAGEGHGPPAGVRGGAGVRRDEGIPPYGRSVCTAPPGKFTRFRREKPCRGGFHIRPGCSRREPGRCGIGPYIGGVCRGRSGKPQAPRHIALCRGRCSHRPGGACGGAGFAGGACPSPTNRGKRLAKQNGRPQPPYGRSVCTAPTRKSTRFRREKPGRGGFHIRPGCEPGRYRIGPRTETITGALRQTASPPARTGRRACVS